MTLLTSIYRIKFKVFLVFYLSIWKVTGIFKLWFQTVITMKYTSCHSDVYKK